MPRSEARIFTSIWKDPHFLEMDADAQRLYMFLLSQDDLSYCGAIPLRIPRWAAKAAGLTTAGVEASLKVLEANPRQFVVTDHDTGELLVRSLLRRDEIWRQPNLLKRARESAEQLESPLLRVALRAELTRLPLEETPSEQVRTLVAEFIQDLDQGTAYPSLFPTADLNPEDADDPAHAPSGNPTAEDYARVRGLGERNGSSSSFPQAPIPSAPSLPRRDRKLGTHLPDTFVLTPEMRAWASQNAPHVNQDREFDRFRDYWNAKPGKEGRKLDWLATWRNWMRTAEDRQGPRDRGSPRSSPYRNPANQSAYDEEMRPA